MKKITHSFDTKLTVDKERIAVLTPSVNFFSDDAELSASACVGTTTGTTPTTITTTMICFLVNASEAAAN